MNTLWCRVGRYGEDYDEEDIKPGIDIDFDKSLIDDKHCHFMFVIRLWHVFFQFTICDEDCEQYGILE